MMDLLGNLALGLSVAATPLNLLYAFVGSLIGTLIGVLPGIGPVATIAMLLPATYGLPPVTALIMLAGIYYGASYGGSTTAILVNLPGEMSSVVTVLDGHQMAKQGRAGAALCIAALGSFFAGTVATIVISAFAPPLADVALKFDAAEYFSLMVLGLISAVALAHGSVLKAVLMTLLGLLLGTVGTDVNSGMARFTFNRPELIDGIGFVAISMGLFAFAEIALNLERATRQRSGDRAHRRAVDHMERVQAVLPGCSARLGDRVDARHPAGGWRDALGLRLLRAGKEGSRQTPRASARAPSKASPVPSRRTTPAPRHRSSRCSPSAFRPMP